MALETVVLWCNILCISNSVIQSLFLGYRAWLYTEDFEACFRFLHVM